MQTKKTKFQEGEVIIAVLKRLTQRKLDRYVGIVALDYRWVEALEYHGWGGVYRGKKPGGGEQASDELSVNVFLDNKQVKQAVLRVMKEKHPRLFANFPKEWKVKIALGYRDSYGSITIWAEG